MGGVLDEQTQTIIKPRFYLRLCQFLTKIIPVINCVCACVRTSPEDDNFPRGGAGRGEGGGGGGVQ